jgi:WD40 repeat protein
MTTLGHLLVGRPTRETAESEAMFRDERRRRRKRRGTIGLVVLVLAAGGAITAAVVTSSSKGPAQPGSRRPSNTPVVDGRAFAGEGLLAFASDGALYLLDGGNGALRQVGHLTSGAEDPTFSPDRRYLAYIAAGAETDAVGGPQAPSTLDPGPLVVADATGAGARTITAVGDVSAAAWSPTADALLVVSGSPYDGTSVWLVSTNGTVRKLATGSPVYGAVWSPDGRDVAVAVGGGTSVTSTLEAVPLNGGAPTVWARSGQDGQWLVPIGWWKDQGIGVWVGGNGSVPSGAGTLDGAQLAIVPRPGGTPREVGHTPPQALVPAAVSSSGWLAVDLEAPSSFGRTPWTKKSIVTCAPGSPRCVGLQEPANLTALDPAWSADGSTLAFVGAAASDLPSFFPAFVEHWYASAQLLEVTAGSTAPTTVVGTGGASAPVWSSTGDGLLFVRDDALYLVPRPGAVPHRIAGPLLPASEWTSTSFGGIDWRFLFAWAG